MKRAFAFALTLAATAAYWMQEPTGARAQSRELPNTGLADASNLMRLYGQFRTGRTDQYLNIPLVSFGPLSAEDFDAAGRIRIDMRSRQLTSTVSGLPAGEYDLWLIDNRGTGGAFADAGDMMLRVGAYRAGPDGALTLAAELPANGMEYDRAMLTRAGRNPMAGFLLAGSANLYERLERGYVKAGERAVSSEDDYWQLVARGRQLFKSERFQGNTRTCGTCHVESNNFTLDPAFIATLPVDDPLFIHERNADLKVNFEDAQMLRKLGLVLGNGDGGEDLARKYTLRPPQSLQSVATQIAAPEPEFFPDFTAISNAANPPERTGWANDNLPLRDFALGAVAQHMPKSLARKAGSDFRLATDDELDALAAYQLSIGRMEDFDLKKLKLRYADAAEGQRLYTDTGAIGEPGHKNCNACHFNGGGTVGYTLNGDARGFSPVLDAVVHGYNGSMGTNVNGLPVSKALRLPPDGGFGRALTPFGSFGNFGFIPGVGEFPVEEFNSMSVVESADTAPYFHNHAVATLEEAVAFYGTAAYASVDSIGDKDAGPIPVKISDKADDPEVMRISAFLRVLNVLENMRSALSAAERARRAAALTDAKELAALAREEVMDALEVSSQGLMAAKPDFSVTIMRVRLIGARQWLESARDARDAGEANQALANAVGLLRAARALLVDEATLPETFRN